MRRVVFRLIQLAWFPVAAASYIPFVARLLVSSRRSGVSATTLASMYARWMQHQLGTRIDEPCARLMEAFPGVSVPLLRLTTAGTRLAHRVTGCVPPIYRYPYEGEASIQHESVARTTLIDAALQRHVDTIDQLVILGAGWDTRSFRVPERIRCFELDTPRTQEAKRRSLRAAGLDASRITFVPVDFMVQSWFEQLVAAAYEPSRPTLFVWEGVTPYLDREAVEAVLRTVAGTATGSAIAFDYLSYEVIASPSPFWRYVRAVTTYIDEPLRFGMHAPAPARTHVEAFLQACGLAMEEHRNFGRETVYEPAKAGFATAVVP